MEVSTVLTLIASGQTIDEDARAYSRRHLTPKAVQEVIRLADQALVQLAQRLVLDQVYEHESSLIDPILPRMQAASLAGATW